jgi:hypothetical protein
MSPVDEERGEIGVIKTWADSPEMAGLEAGRLVHEILSKPFYLPFERVEIRLRRGRLNFEIEGIVLDSGVVRDADQG